MLVHAPGTVVLCHERLGYPVAVAQFNYQVAAAAAAGAFGKIGMSGDAGQQDRFRPAWRPQV